MARKYDIGFITSRPNDMSKYITSCSCGVIHLHDTYPRYDSKPCKNCGNKNFVYISDSQKKKREPFPYLQVLEKSRKGFKLLRTNLSVMIGEGYEVAIKENMRQVLIYDIVNKKIRLYKNGTTIPSLRQNISRFFYQIDSKDIIDMVAVPENREFLDYCWKNHSYDKGSYSRGYEKRFWKMILNIREKNLEYMQILSNAGFTNLDRFRSYYSRWGGNNYTLNKDGKNPKEILGLPKFALKYIRENESFGTNDIRDMQDALKKIDGNNFKAMIEIVKDEGTMREFMRCIDSILELKEKYGYNNMKKIILYLFREIRMTQGIDSPSNGASLLRDYVRMSVDLKEEYEKYPKSLKKEHDLVMVNYNIQKDAIKKRKFAEIVAGEDYKALEFADKEYSIITPTEMKDIVNEGDELSHCVASYVNSINEGKCKILFLRKSDSVDVPLATVEVRGEKIRQARGRANRRLTEKEVSFVDKWSKEKELIVDYYY